MIESRLTPGKDISCYSEMLVPLAFSTTITNVTSFVTVGQGDPWHYEIYVHFTGDYRDDDMIFHMTIFAINEHGLRAVGSYQNTISELTHEVDWFNWTLHHKTGSTS